MKNIIKTVNACNGCGPKFKGMSAVGFGKTEQPLIMFIGQNPRVDGKHNFKNGVGITELIRRLKDYNFNDFYFDNVVKCQMPTGIPIEPIHAANCSRYTIDQIKVIQPKGIITFGSYAHQNYMLFCKPCFSPIPVTHLAHFSFPMYASDKSEALNKYYKLLFETIEQIKGRNK